MKPGLLCCFKKAKKANNGANELPPRQTQILVTYMTAEIIAAAHDTEINCLKAMPFDS